MSTNRILCPVDLFDHSCLVLRYARAIAAERGERIVLLTVMEPLLQASALVHESERLERELLADLEKLNDEVPPIPATRPDWRVRKGRPYAEILAACRDDHCDLIVMGTHGRRGLTKMFLGSTLERVMRETTVPVLAIPPNASSLLSCADAQRLAIRRVLVGIDFDEPSMVAARMGAAVARQHGARLELLHVVPPPALRRGYESFMQGVYEHRLRTADSDLRRLTTEFCTEHIRAASSVVTGEPEEIIAEQACEQPGTLIMLGLRSAKDLSGAYPGATAYRVLRLSKVPVMVVPGGAY